MFSNIVRNLCILQTATIGTNIVSAVVAVIVLHLALGLFIYKVRRNSELKAMFKLTSYSNMISFIAGILWWWKEEHQVWLKRSFLDCEVHPPNISGLWSLSWKHWLVNLFFTFPDFEGLLGHKAELIQWPPPELLSVMFVISLWGHGRCFSQRCYLSWKYPNDH